MAEDYLLRQIEGFGRALGYLLTGKREAGKEIHMEAESLSGPLEDLIQKHLLMELVSQDAVGKAEDLLYELVEEDSLVCPQEVAAWFYHLLRSLPQEKLTRGGFSPGEIDQGETDIQVLLQEKLCP